MQPPRKRSYGPPLGGGAGAPPPPGPRADLRTGSCRSRSFGSCSGGAAAGGCALATAGGGGPAARSRIGSGRGRRRSGVGRWVLQAELSSFESWRRRNPAFKSVFSCFIWTPACSRLVALMLDTGATQGPALLHMCTADTCPQSPDLIFTGLLVGLATPDTTRFLPPQVVVRLTFGEEEPLRDAIDMTTLDLGPDLGIIFGWDRISRRDLRFLYSQGRVTNCGPLGPISTPFLPVAPSAAHTSMLISHGQFHRMLRRVVPLTPTLSVAVVGSAGPVLLEAAPLGTVGNHGGCQDCARWAGPRPARLLHRSVVIYMDDLLQAGELRHAEAVPAPVLGTFDSSWRSVVTADASEVAISAALTQPNDDSHYHLVGYESRKFMAVEQAYSLNVLPARVPQLP